MLCVLVSTNRSLVMVMFGKDSMVVIVTSSTFYILIRGAVCRAHVQLRISYWIQFNLLTRQLTLWQVFQRLPPKLISVMFSRMVIAAVWLFLQHRNHELLLAFKALHVSFLNLLFSCLVRTWQSTEALSIRFRRLTFWMKWFLVCSLKFFCNKVTSAYNSRVSTAAVEVSSVLLAWNIHTAGCRTAAANGYRNQLNDESTHQAHHQSPCMTSWRQQLPLW